MNDVKRIQTKVTTTLRYSNMKLNSENKSEQGGSMNKEMYMRCKHSFVRSKTALLTRLIKSCYETNFL
jgi:hypothetical protein